MLANTTGTSNQAEESEFTFKTTFSTNRVLLDLGAVQPASFDLKKTERDCDLIKEMLQSHPEAIEQLLGALAGEKGGKIAQVLEVSEVLEKIGFTEKAAVEKGGGFLFLVVLLGAALLAEGCTGVTATGAAGKTGPQHP